MDKYLLLVAVIFLAGVTAAEPMTEIQVQEQDPGIPEPGDTVKMSLVVSNSGDTSQTYKPLELETTDSMEYLGTTSNFAEEFSLCGGCQTTGTLYIKVKEDTVTSSYPIDITAVNEEGIGITEKQVIEVDGSPNLVLNAEASVKQGDNSEMKLEIENTGTEKATQLSTSLEHSYISFQPSKTVFETLDPGETAEKNIEINADESIETGPETVNALIKYTEDGIQRTENSSISVDILKDVRIAVSNIETDAEVGSDSRVMLELQNIGNSEAEQIRTELRCEGASETKSQSFVGSLEEDESVPTVYSIVPEQEKTSCTLKANYTGEELRSFNESFNVSADEENRILPLTVISGIALLAIILLRKRRSILE